VHERRNLRLRQAGGLRKPQRACKDDKQGDESGISGPAPGDASFRCGFAPGICAPV